MFQSKRMIISLYTGDFTIIALNCQEYYLLARTKGNTRKTMFIKQNEAQGLKKTFTPQAPIRQVSHSQ